MNKLKKRGIWIPVVTGLLRKEGKILLGRRPVGESLAGAWEFPGGKIDQGELPQEALARELQEEVGIEAEIGPLRLVHTHSYGERGVLLVFYDVHFWKGEPKTLYHEDLIWVAPDELRRLEIPEANRRILDHLIHILKNPQT
ncbi:MAG: (deoxy)nucleoside triphosphate pyrophosphohydrolase [Oligoflexia bacterium]|nr:(deoxy)nucleoside triphosphate pyrophosphohydrolase [Oligoflexia bacterium]